MSNNKEQKMDPKQEEQLKQIYAKVQEGIKLFCGGLFEKKMQYYGFLSSFISRKDAVGEIANKVLETYMDKNTLDMGSNEIEIPSNYSIVNIEIEDHEKILAESFTRGIPIFRKIEQKESGENTTVTIKHYLIISEMNTVLYDEVSSTAKTQKSQEVVPVQKFQQKPQKVQSKKQT